MTRHSNWRDHTSTARRLHVFGKLVPLDDDRSGMPKLGAIAWANFACWLIALMIAASCFFLTYGS